MPNARIRSTTDAWANILPVEIEQIDTNLAAAINGDDGSTHAPLAPIIILGLGGMLVVGPTLVTRGAVLSTSGTPSLPSVLCGANDWPVLDPSNSFQGQPRYVACAEGVGLPEHTWCVRQENGGLQAYSAAFDLLDGQGMRPSRAYVRLRAHVGSTLSGLRVFFHVGWPHTSLPTVMPGVRILRIDTQGNVTALTSQAAGADVNGYVYVKAPSSAAAWTNNFAQQEFDVPCDQNNLIDAGNYAYVVELLEEQGLTGYPWQLTYFFNNIIAATAGTNIASLSGFPTIDGVVLGSGDFLLVKDQSDPNQNGIYEVLVGAWARVAYGFSQGFVMPIQLGNVNGGTWWQASSLVTQWLPTVVGSSTSPNPITFVSKTDQPFPTEGTALFAHGILWQSLIPQYTEIPDLRPG